MREERCFGNYEGGNSLGADSTTINGSNNSGRSARFDTFTRRAFVISDGDGNNSAETVDGSASIHATEFAEQVRN